MEKAKKNGNKNKYDITIFDDQGNVEATHLGVTKLKCSYKHIKFEESETGEPTCYSGFPYRVKMQLEAPE